jgi:XRE family aerobic/anaerobic benzoate catabolism transcriptional regulator
MSTQAQSSEAASAGFAEIGQRIRSARAKIGMTRRQLAAASGTSERYLAHLEGGIGNPSIAVLATIAEALDVAAADLLPRGGERSDERGRIAQEVRRLPSERLGELSAWLQANPGRSSVKARRLMLVGLRGAGKTSLGSALADWLDVPFLEISKEVEQLYGASIGLLIELNGQGALRRYEADAWERICDRYEAAVVAAPGGIVADAPLYDRTLATAHSIWLRATPDDHMARVMAQGDFRPMGSNRGAMADLKAILDARSADYARADAQIDTSRQAFPETLDRLKNEAKRLLGN